MTNAATFFKYKQLYKSELLENIIPFWEKHSIDRVNGGYFNCLDRDGSIYDRRKNVWLQGRQVWMFSRLYNTVEKRPEWLEIARLGAEFLKKHAIRPDRRVYFSVTETGAPLGMQRKIFSECFYVMAMAEYARASGEQRWMDEATLELEKIWQWSSDLTKVGRPSFAGEPAAQSLAIPMILLNLLEVVAGDNLKKYEAEARECIRRMLLHVHTDQETVFEMVAPDGAFIDTIEGRTLNPGHAIEAGWFLLHWAQYLNNPQLAETAQNMVRWSFARGWDKEHGGILYFLDSRGYSPSQLEWPMKLWWPHVEALYAHLLNYSVSKRADDWAAFEKTHEYTFKHFPDRTHGEWFGYLDREGKVSQRFKGGPYKGCFHIPRALWLCWRLFEKLEKV